MDTVRSARQLDIVQPILDVDKKLSILASLSGERIDPLPEWQAGKLVLWYGGEWEEYDEYSEQTTFHSRYTAGAYLETIALNPDVITEPKYIADAVLRINQHFDDAEFAVRFLNGLLDTDSDERPQDHSCDVLFTAGDYGKAGHWPCGFDWETGEITWQMQPEELGMAIATFINPEWVSDIGIRMIDSVQNKP